MTHCLYCEGNLYPHGPTTVLYVCDHCTHQCSPETAVALASLQIEEDHDIVIPTCFVRDHVPPLADAQTA